MLDITAIQIEFLIRVICKLNLLFIIVIFLMTKPNICSYWTFI